MTAREPKPHRDRIRGQEGDKYTDHRGISSRVNKFYGTYTGMHGDTEIDRAYLYPHSWKVRILPKDFTQNTGFTNDHLFGMDKFNAGSSKFLTIVEGEEDTMSAYQMLGEKYPVVGLPGASISKKLLINCHDYIDSFQNIIVCTDSDDAGNKAANKLAETFPNKVYRVPLTLFKDANEFLMAGKTSEFMYAWINRTKYVPEFDTSTTDQFLKLYDEGQDSIYIPTGLENFDENHLGLFQGHFTIFQAPEGIGKTELMRYLEYNLLKNHPDVPIAMCHLEESQLRSLLGLVSYDLKKNVTRKELIDDEAAVKDSIERLSSNENMHMFTLGLDEDPLVLIERIKYYANVCECKYVFIEPIQDVAHQRTGGESTEQFLTKLSVLLSRVANETGCGIIAIAHENDDGQIRDCRMIGKQASVVVRLERDVDSENEEVRNTTTLVSLKNRPAAFVGFGGQVKFDVDSFTIGELV